MKDGQLPFPPEPADIQKRFCDEQQEIQRYVEVVRARADFTEPELVAIARLLERNDLLDAPVPEVREGSGIRSYRKAIAKLERWPEKYEARVQGELEEAKACVTTLGDPPRLPDGNWVAPVDEWVDCMTERLRDDTSPGQVQYLREEGLRHMQQNADEESDPTLVEPEVIDFAIQAALYQVAVQKVHDLSYVLDSLTQLGTLRRIGSRRAAIHILRQGFMLLMTAFDAAMFDLLRIALRDHFFSLIGSVGQKGTMRYSDMSRYSSFEDFREDVIDQQLRRRYVRDVLLLLHDMGATLTDEASGDSFAHLVEIVLRRNVHIHNRGVVDPHYMGDQRGFNVYGLGLGQAAEIDPDYWTRANRLTANCVAATTSWAESPSCG